MFFYFLPLHYTFVTRINSWKTRVAWIFTYLFPVVIASFYSNPQEFHFIWVPLFFVFGIYSVYEMGYMYNDAVLTKREVNPTIRLNSEQVVFFEKNQVPIYVLRLFFSSLVFLALYLFSATVAYSFLVSFFSVALLFSVYNSVRSRINIPLYSFLVFFRYFGALLFLSWWQLMLLWVAYPLCATIEFSTKRRFGLSIPFALEGSDIFRVFYYCFFAFVVMVLGRFVDVWPVFFVLILYFFFYRVAGLVLASSLYRK